MIKHSPHSPFAHLLGITVVPREIENNAYTIFWGQTRCILGDLHVVNASNANFKTTKIPIMHKILYRNIILTCNSVKRS